jgi:hypothetical protein
MNPCTPGPWTVTPHYDGYHEDSSHGVFTIEEVEAEATKLYEAVLDAEPDSAEEQDAAQQLEALQDSTARLIAAAPDLLDALILLHEASDGLLGESEWMDARLKQAKAAIKKATQP